MTHQKCLAVSVSAETPPSACYCREIVGMLLGFIHSVRKYFIVKNDQLSSAFTNPKCQYLNFAANNSS